jgi:hypothetical protein
LHLLQQMTLEDLLGMEGLRLQADWTIVMSGGVAYSLFN